MTTKARQSSKAIITDHGGVLSWREETRGALERWRRQLDLDEETFRLALFDRELGRSIAIGHTSPSEGSRLIAQRLGVDVESLELLRKECWSDPILNREFIEFLGSLGASYKLACLTNWGLDARTRLKERGLIDIFDLIVISAEEGMAKPDERIFRLTLDRLGVAPEEAIFVDDSEEYVEAATQLGIQAVRFENTERTVQELRELISAWDQSD